jgi:hypothetical protein
MRQGEHYFEDFRCIVCDGQPFDSSSAAHSALFQVHELVGERCACCGHQMTLNDIEAMTHAAEIHMIRSLFPLH